MREIFTLVLLGGLILASKLFDASMLTPFALFFGLTIATAVIAYWSDNLGKKLGKKRVSLFGLRPRTTATVLTVASSWGIMLFTLVTLLAVFEPLRTAIFSFDQQRILFRQQLQENKKQLALNKTLTLETTSLKDKAQQAQKARQEAEEQTHKAQGRTREAQKGEQAALKAEQISHQREQKARQSEQVAKRGQEAARQGQQEAEAQTKAAVLHTAVAQHDLQLARGRLRKTESNLTAAQSRLTDTQQRLSQAQTRLAVAQQKVTAAEQKRKFTEGKLEGAYKELFAAYKELGTAQQAKDKALKDLDEAKAAVNKLYVQFQQLAPLSNGDIRVHFEQTFAARVIEPDQPEADIEAQIRDILKDARAAAPNLIPGSQVVLVNRISSDDQFIDLSEDQYITQLVNYIQLQHEPVSVRVSSLRNYTEEEKELVARFVVVPLRRAFKAGETLGEITIDGSASEARIFNALFTRLIEIGRQNATQKGVNPPQSPEEPNFYASGTNDALFDALSQIKNAGTLVSVRLVAAQDLNTAQPLQVRFEITPGVPS